jgi:hypothetical protein
LSIGDVLLQVVREAPTNLGSLVGWVNEMVIRMQDNISTFPTDVRVLLRKFGSITDDPVSKLNRIEMLFIDCIAAPAISTPKAHCILPPTFSLDMSPDGPARSLQMLAQLFRFILHGKQAQVRYPALDVVQLEKIPLASFLKKLTNIDHQSADLGGPCLRNVMRYMGAHFAVMLFAVQDVCLLAKMLNGDAFPNARGIPVDRQMDFEFFHYEIWEVECLGIVAPDIQENCVAAPPPSKLTAAASALYKFLTYAKEDDNAPADLANFLKYHEAGARTRVDFKKYTYMNHVILKFGDLTEPDFPEIFPALDDELRRQREFVDRNYALMTGIARVTMHLDAEVDAYRRKADQSYSILYGCLLSSFLEQESSLPGILLARRNEFLVDKKQFMDFIGLSLSKLKQWVSSIADFAFPHVAAHLHTWVMQRMPLDQFIRCHEECRVKDDDLSSVPKRLIEDVCIKPAPQKLSQIFDHPPLFQFCKIELHNAEFVELPLEAIERITAAITLIQKMFELAFGGVPQADEMTPLFNYALLSSGLGRMFSLHKYLEHFLLEMPPGDAHFLDEGRSVALTHFVNHVSSLEQLVNQPV